MKILLIEDEAMAVQRLTKMINAIEPMAEILGDLDTIEGAVQWFQENSMPDLLFLDIHLADGSSFEIFKKINITCPIIFTTAYDEYALQAFKVNAIDYLLKPIKKAELEQSFEKFKRLQPTKNMDYQTIIQAIQEKNPPTYQSRFLIRYGQKFKIVEVKDIAYFFIQEKIVFACTFEGKHYPMDYNLDKLEPMLSPTEFFRINRQVMARHSAIQELYAYSKSRVKVELLPRMDYEVVVSKERTSLFKDWLEGK
jgi:DNA-binding LytR/AlgR family response regulator